MGRKLVAKHSDNDNESLFFLSRLTPKGVKLDNIDFVCYYATRIEMHHVIKMEMQLAIKMKI